MAKVLEKTQYCNRILYKMYQRYLTNYNMEISYPKFLLFIRSLINREIENDIK